MWVGVHSKARLLAALLAYFLTSLSHRRLILITSYLNALIVASGEGVFIYMSYCHFRPRRSHLRHLQITRLASTAIAYLQLEHRRLDFHTSIS